MAPRASTSRRFFRGVPRSYLVHALVAAIIVVTVVSIDRSRPRSSAPPIQSTKVAIQSAKIDDEIRYTGSIIFPTNTVGVCWTIKIDNRTGYLTDGGYGNCQPAASREAPKEAPQAARLRGLGSAFRRAD